MQTVKSIGDLGADNKEGCMMKTWEEAIVEEVSFVDTAEGSDTFIDADKEWTDNGRLYAYSRS